MNSAYFDPPGPRLFAHRGASGDLPENTMPAFRVALEEGVPYLEMDVWSTADGEIVVHHDETLLRLCGDPRRVSDVNLDELKGLDAGFGFSPDGGRTHPFRGRGITVPTLGEVLETFPEAFCNIEIKQGNPPVEEKTVETVFSLGAERRVLLAAEQDLVMQRIRSCCRGLPTSLSFGELKSFFAWVQGGCRGIYHPPGRSLQIPSKFRDQTLATPETVQAARAVGLEMHIWTVNEPEEMRRLLDLGVDGLMSDFPARLMEVGRSWLGRK